MKPFSRIAGLLSAASVLFLAGCGGMAHAWYLSSCDRDISSSTRAVESARDNAQRAAAYTKRGSDYSEKARYSRAFKLISGDEYDRLFGLAIKDHDQGVALNPASAEAYYSRGQTYYDRAVLEVIVNGMLVGTDSARKAWFAPAIADLKKAVEKDERHYLAWDRLGQSHETSGELDLAISDYLHEQALNPLGRMRLADAYCARGSANQGAKKYDAALADYEQSIDTRAAQDGCSCDPYYPLLQLYVNGRRYDQGWKLVNGMRKNGIWLAPELLDRLKKESGRGD